MGTMNRGSRPTGRRWLAVACGLLTSMVPVGTAVAGAAATATVAAAPPRTPVAGGGLPAPFVGTSYAPRSGRAVSNSLDWAGFAVTGPTVASVSGSWIQPAVTCPAKKLQQSAFWVGIDGFSSSDPTVQQVGTDADCTKKVKKVPSAPVHYAWFEMYPAPLVVLDPATYPVTPGDLLTASVTVSGADYVLAIADAGHWSYSTTQPGGSPAPLNSSAEWITEAPTTCGTTRCKPVPLANFGAVAFTGAKVNGLPVTTTGFTDHLITMTKNKKGTIIKAATSALDPTGHDFGVTWVAN
jgi:hypothetical protein